MCVLLIDHDTRDEESPRGEVLPRVFVRLPGATTQRREHHDFLRADALQRRRFGQSDRKRADRHRWRIADTVLLPGDVFARSARTSSPVRCILGVHGIVLDTVR